MPTVYLNLVGQSVSGTPGTGTITLGAALPGLRALAATVDGITCDGETFDVTLIDGANSSVERDCLYNSTAGTLARGTVESSTTGSRLSLTSAATVRVVAAASRIAGWGAGGGGSKTLDRHTPMTSQPPATAFATLDTRNSIAVLDFDAAADESATWVGVIPEGANLASGLSVRIVWTATSATSGNCRWRVALEDLIGSDIDADSFDTVAEGTGAANGTSGIPTTTAITITTIDSLVAGDAYRLRVTRVATDATNDTMTGDAELITVEVRQVA